MFKWVRQLWAWLVQIEETQSVVLWLVSPLGGGWAMISAYRSGLAWHEILFWGSGVFAFLMVGLFQAWTWRQKTTVFEKLRLMEVRVGDILKESEDSEQIGIITQYRFRNASDVPMYFRLTRINVTIDGHVNPRAELNTSIILIQPHDDQMITAAIVPDIDQKEALAGAAEFSIQYGPKRDRLRYVLEHKGTLQLGVVPGEEARAVHVTARMRHKKIEHSVRSLE